MRALWMGVMPGPKGVRVLVQEGPARTLLKAVLPCAPRDPRALAAMSDALAMWVGAPVRAALCADDESVLSDETSWLEAVCAFDGEHCEIRMVVGHEATAEEDPVGALGDFDDVRDFVRRWVAR